MPNMIPPPVLLPLAMKTMAATKHTEARNPAQPGLAGKRGPPFMSSHWTVMGPSGTAGTTTHTGADKRVSTLEIRWTTSRNTPKSEPQHRRGGRAGL